MTLKYRPYSFSKISTFEQCNKRFYYQYIQKLKVPDKPQIFFDRGKFLHLLMEHEGDLKKVKNTKAFKEIVKHKLMNKEDITDAYNVYKNFISSPIGKSILSKKRILAEFPIGLNDNLELQNYHENPILRGYIDDLRTYKDIGIIIDYKSGKYVQKEDQNYSQLLWYSLGLFSMDKTIDKIILIFAYLEHNKINTIVVQRKDIQRYKKALFDKIQKIEDETIFEKNETALCEYCPFFEVCLED